VAGSGPTVIRIQRAMRSLKLIENSDSVLGQDQNEHLSFFRWNIPDNSRELRAVLLDRNASSSLSP
jgi:hypothetical protein